MSQCKEIRDEDTSETFFQIFWFFVSLEGFRTVPVKGEQTCYTQQFRNYHTNVLENVTFMLPQLNCNCKKRRNKTRINSLTLFHCFIHKVRDRLHFHLYIYKLVLVTAHCTSFFFFFVLFFPSQFFASALLSERLEQDMCDVTLSQSSRSKIGSRTILGLRLVLRFLNSSKSADEKLKCINATEQPQIAVLLLVMHYKGIRSFQSMGEILCCVYRYSNEIHQALLSCDSSLRVLKKWLLDKYKCNFCIYLSLQGRKRFANNSF